MLKFFQITQSNFIIFYNVNITAVRMSFTQANILKHLKKKQLVSLNKFNKERVFYLK